MIKLNKSVDDVMNELRDMFLNGAANEDAVQFLRSNRYHRYEISVMPMKESHRETHWVYVTRDDRAPDASMLDNELVHTPFMSEELAKTVYNAAELAKFLDVPFDHPLIEETPWMKILLK